MKAEIHFVGSWQEGIFSGLKKVLHNKVSSK